MCKVLLTAKKGGKKATGNTCKAKKGGQSNQGEGKPMQLKWTEKKFREKFTKSLKLLKGEYDDKSVNLFGENIIERLKLDEICAKSCTDETKEWIVRPDTRKPTYNAITHIPKLISQIVLKKPKEKFNRTWVKESLNPGSNHISSGMINALENLVRIGILEDVDKSFKDRGFLYYRLSLDLFRGLKRKKGNENEKEKKIKVENQVVIDLTSDDSSDDFNDGNASKQKHDNNEETTVTVHIGAATTSNAVVQLNQDCALNDSNDISAKKYENANVVEQPKMATPVNTTAATSTSAETTAATSTSAEPLTDSNEEELDKATWHPLYLKLMSVNMGTKRQLTDLQRLNQKLSVGTAEEEEGKKKYCPAPASVQQSWKDRYVMLQKSNEEYKIHLDRARDLNGRLQKMKKENKKENNKKKKKDEQKHPILRCEIPWNELDGTLKNHMMALGFRTHSWMGEQGDLPAQFLSPWDRLNENLQAAAGAFGCTELSWNSKEPAFIFTNPKLCVLID